MPYEVIDDLPETAVHDARGKSRAELRDAIRNASLHKWVVVPNDSGKPISYFRTLIAQNLRNGRDGHIDVTTRCDKKLNCLYIRENRD